MTPILDARLPLAPPKDQSRSNPCYVTYRHAGQQTGLFLFTIAASRYAYEVVSKILVVSNATKLSLPAANKSFIIIIHIKNLYNMHNKPHRQLQTKS